MKQEYNLQAMVNQYCLYNKIYFCCINNNQVPAMFNGVYNREFAIKQAVKQKKIGLKKGVADAFIILNNKVIFIEFKTYKGKQSLEQKQFENICKENNIKYYIVRSLEQFINVVGENKLC